MVGGTLKIRDAFLIDYDNIDEVITRYTPVVDTIPIPAIQNLVTNGHFSDIDSDGVGNNIGEFVKKSDSTGIIQDFPNPRSIKTLESLALVRGMESGLKMAESFQLIKKVVN